MHDVLHFNWFQINYTVPTEFLDNNLQYGCSLEIASAASKKNLGILNKCKGTGLHGNPRK